jgi:hypothetical protein
MRKESLTGLLIGAGTALGIAWLFGPKLAALLRGGNAGDKERTIVLKTRASGEPGINEIDSDLETVVVRKNKHLTWWVINESDAAVLVSLENWKDGSGGSIPAVDPDPDDHDQPPQSGLSREVPKNKKRPIRGKARGPLSGNSEEVHYDVYLDTKPAADPIVKLTP